MCYIFYKSYQKQTKLTNLKNKDDIILADSISSNTKNIEKLNLVIEALNNNVMKINQSFKINENEKKGANEQVENILDELKNEIQSLNKKLESIQKITENNKNIKNNIISSNTKKNNLNEIINIIKLKFENGKNFSEELKVLDKIGETNTKAMLEKLYILNGSNFIGNENLLIEFQGESNIYISNVIISNKNLIKPLLSFIELQPSNKKKLSNKSLINLKNISELLKNKEYEKSLSVLKELNRHNEFFNETIEQLEIGKSFYSVIDEVI